jgi:hypothetical protein
MLSQSKLFTRLALLTFTVPLVGFSAAIQAVGTTGPTVCELQNCSSPDSIGLNQSAAGNYAFTYTFTNGDTYNVKGNYFNYYPPQELLFDPTVTYTGNGGSAIASKGVDVLSLTMLQNFFDTTPGNWNGNYCEHFGITVPNVAGDSATGDVSFDGNGVGLLTAGAGSSGFQSACASLSFTNAQNASPTMDTLSNVTFTFAAGTTPGTVISSLTPEPAQTIPVALGLVGLLALKVRKNRSAGRS